MTWGLVLSGGTAWGIANGGVVEALEEANLRPDCIAGSSMGAIVAALYAAGHPASAMRDLCKSLCLRNVAAWDGKPFQGGLHGGLLRQCIAEHLSPLLGDTRIGDCTIPFVCVAGKVRSAIRWERMMKEGFTEHAEESVELFVFPDDTKLIDAIMASSAIPIVFKPAMIGEDTFVDLLSFGSVPARTLRERYKPDIVIGTDTNDRRTGLQRFLPKAFRRFIDKGFASLDESLQACDLVITPKIPYGSYRFDKGAEIFECGKRAAEEAMPRIRGTLKMQ